MKLNPDIDLDFDPVDEAVSAHGSHRREPIGPVDGLLREVHGRNKRKHGAGHLYDMTRSFWSRRDKAKRSKRASLQMHRLGLSPDIIDKSLFKDSGSFGIHAARRVMARVNLSLSFVVDTLGAEVAPR